MKSYFYHLHRYEVPFKPRVSSDEIRKKFEAFDPNPARIKNVTDHSSSLLKKLLALNIKTELLKVREAKALAELKHFLKHSFGNVYDYDYYSGTRDLVYCCYCAIALSDALTSLSFDRKDGK